MLWKELQHPSAVHPRLADCPYNVKRTMFAAQMFNWLYDSSTAEEFAEHQTDLQCLLEALHWVFNRASIYHQHNKERGDCLA